MVQGYVIFNRFGENCYLYYEKAECLQSLKELQQSYPEMGYDYKYVDGYCNFC